VSLYVNANGKVWCSDTGGVLRPAEPSPVGATNPDNFVTITNTTGSPVSDYPVQLGRPFMEAELADYPQAVVDGVPVTTQAHVEQRWDDGSVKHAVLFFHIPTLPAVGTSVVIGFQNQATGNTTGGLSAATVLADWDFDATMDLVQSAVTKSASARTMLSAGHYTTLYSGSVATCFIIADHSASATYDLGWDAYAPFRPIFHATFWPLTDQTKIRYIGELSKTTQLATVTVSSITLKHGEASPSTAYTKATSTAMNYGSRWTKQYWKGGTPAVVSTNHNLAYLASTMLVPNYDTDRVMPEATIATESARWTAASKDLYGAGNWQKIMSNVGGRDDIGMFPGWLTPARSLCHPLLAHGGLLVPGAGVDVGGVFCRVSQPGQRVLRRSRPAGLLRRRGVWRRNPQGIVDLP
jgi:hypothetical protein